jgi:hypothetical protein
MQLAEFQVLEQYKWHHMYPEDSGSRFFRNIGTVVTEYLID